MSLNPNVPEFVPSIAGFVGAATDGNTKAGSSWVEVSLFVFVPLQYTAITI